MAQENENNNENNENNEESKYIDYSVSDLYGSFDKEKGMTDEFKSNLEKLNVKPELFESYVELQGIKQEKLKNTIIETAGGEDAHEQIIQWANKNVDENTLNSINDLLSNINTAEIAMDGLKSKFEKATGKSFNKEIKQETKTNKKFGTDEYIDNTQASKYEVHSKADISKLINDPRYAVDGKYRLEVSKAIKKSGIR